MGLFSWAESASMASIYIIHAHQIKAGNYTKAIIINKQENPMTQIPLMAHQRIRFLHSHSSNLVASDFSLFRGLQETLAQKVRKEPNWRMTK